MIIGATFRLIRMAFTPLRSLKALRKLGLAAKKGRNLEWDTLRSEIAAGHPVIVWIVGQMWAGEPVLYTTSDGSQTLTARFEHTMVLTGYTASQVQVLDSYSGYQPNLFPGFISTIVESTWESSSNCPGL